MRDLLAASVCAAAFAGCVLAGAPVRADDPAVPRAPEKAVLKFGTLAPEGTPWADLLERLKERIETASKGELKVKLYLNGRQGDEGEMLAKLGAQKLDGAGLTSSGLAAVVPDLSLLELPFLFEDDAEADHVMDDVVRDDMARLLEAKGLHLYIWAVNGWVDFGSAAKPILSLADLKGAKPYTRESTARRAFWAACGAKAEVVPVPEVAAALRSGKVDLYDTTPLFAAAATWHTTTKHWTDSNHIYQPAAIVFDLKWWKGLPEPLRKALEAFAPELQAGARKAVRGIDANVLEGFRANGIAVHALAPAEREAMKKATAGIAGELLQAGAFKRELYDKVTKALADYRAAHAAKAVDPIAEKLAASDRYTEARPAVADLTRGEAELLDVLRRDPKNFDATWRMARMKYYLGRYGPEATRLPRYEAGMEWAKKTIALRDGRVEGHFWLGVLTGVFGETKGITSSLFLVGDMEKSLERAREIDPAFDGGGPPRVLGRLSFKLPWAAGGSNKKAIEFLRTAMKLDPTMPFNYTYLAEVLIDEDEDAEAKSLLQKLIAMTPAPRWAPEHKEAKVEAERLLKKLD